MKQDMKQKLPSRGKHDSSTCELNALTPVLKKVVL